MRYGKMLAATLGFLLSIAAATAATFEYGDVFAAIGDGKVQHYSGDGTLKDTYQVCNSDTITTGMAFDSAGNLYVTCFNLDKVVKVQRDTGVVLAEFSGDSGGHVESISFDSYGNFYVGQADGTQDIIKFDSAGSRVGRFDVAVEYRGSDWIDLAADQCTIFYTSEGPSIKRYDVCSDTQLPDFANLGGNPSYALRTLSNGGVIVANTYNIKRLDASGSVVQTYDFEGQDCWFALNLDPNGESFWSGDYCNGKFFKFNLDTGAVELEVDTGVGGYKLFGLTVFGERTASRPAITLEPQTATNQIGDEHTVTATVMMDNDPIQGVTVEFEVISGPNAGEMGTDVTNEEGKAFFTYTGDGGTGTDVIVATFTYNRQTYESNQVEKTWEETASVPEFPPLAVSGLGLLAAVILLRARKD